MSYPQLQDPDVKEEDRLPDPNEDDTGWWSLYPEEYEELM